MWPSHGGGLHGGALDDREGDDGQRLTSVGRDNASGLDRCARMGRSYRYEELGRGATAMANLASEQRRSMVRKREKREERWRPRLLSARATCERATTAGLLAIAKQVRVRVLGSDHGGGGVGGEHIGVWQLLADQQKPTETPIFSSLVLTILNRSPKIFINKIVSTILALQLCLKTQHQRVLGFEDFES